MKKLNLLMSILVISGLGLTASSCDQKKEVKKEIPAVKAPGATGVTGVAPAAPSVTGSTGVAPVTGATGTKAP